MNKIFSILEFPCGPAGYGSSIVTVVAQVAAMVPVRSLAQELPHAMAAKKKNNNSKYSLYQIFY